MAHQSHKHYNKDEKKYIANNWQILSHSAMAAQLGRTKTGVEQYCWRKGFVKSNKTKNLLVEGIPMQLVKNPCTEIKQEIVIDVTGLSIKQVFTIAQVLSDNKVKYRAA